MARRRRPRHFQYLDSGMAESYLADLTGGLPEGGSVTERYSNNESEDQEKFRYNPPEAIFRRLYEELDKDTEEEEKILVHLDHLDEDRWNELSDGDVVEVTGTIKLPDILKAFEVAGKIGQFLPFLDEIGGFIGKDVEKDIGIGQKERKLLSGLEGLQGATESHDSTVVVIELVKSPRYRFVAKLRKDYLCTSVGDLEGEAKIVGTVNRKVNEGDPPIGFEQLVPGFEAMRGFQGRQTDGGSSIGYPAATLTPIGIYR